MSNTKQKTYNKEQIFTSNIKYLFDLNKQKNNQKMSNFSSETGINRGTIYGWKDGILPLESNLNMIVLYFNKWLDLNLTRQTLLEQNIAETVEKEIGMVKNIFTDYSTTDRRKPGKDKLTKEEREILKIYHESSPQEQKIILAMMKGLTEK